MKNQFIGKQQQYQQQNLSPRSNKRSIAQEYLKQKRPVHFDISSDSDEIEEQDVQMQRRSYGLKKVDSPPLSTQSFKRRAHTNSYGNKNQEIYELNMKLFAMQNDFLAQKQKLIQKYEKQLFDVNRQKVFLQQEKSKLMKEIDLLNNLNKNYEEEIQQLKQQLQMFVGQNRTTPNFNSTAAKDIGQSQLITMMTHKDQRIKDLQHKLKNLTKEKDQLQNSLTQSLSKPDRSSGQSFGGNKNLYLISFGQIQENLKKTEKSLIQSNEIKETLTKQIEDFKKQLNQELDHSNLLIKQNSALETDRQLKIKQIQALNEKLSKTQNKQYLLEKQLQNLNKKLKINEDLLEIKEKQGKKFSQANEINEQKIKRMKKEHEKNEKEWTSRILKLQNDKSLSINEKIQESKKQQAKLLSKIQSLVSENKKNISLLEQLTVKQQRVKQQASKIEKQRQELTKKLQQSTKQCTKIRHTCTIQEERIIQLQNNCNTLKNEKKLLKQEAQKIMRKQKNEISTLKQSLELMIEKSKKIEQKVKKQEEQITTKEETLSGMKSQLERLNDKLTQEVQKNHAWSQQNSRLSQTIRQHQQLIIQLKTQSYELNKQNDKLKSMLDEKERQSKEFLQQFDSKKNYEQKDIQKAYKNLQTQYRILQTKFDKETTEKEEMVQALGEKIKYYEDRIQQDSARYQETVNEKNYYFQQAESLTYKCKQMYDYIHRMQESQNKEGNQNIDDRNVQGQMQNQPKKDNFLENRQSKQQTQQLQRQNQALKQEVYRVTHEIQQLKSQYRTQLQKIQSYRSLTQSNKKPPKQITSSRKSSSFDSSLHQQNPLESVIQLLKNEKQQMIHTISYQNQMIQQLQQEMANAMVMLHQKNDNSEDNREKQRLDQAYQRNIEMLQGKLQEINQTITEKQKIMVQMRQINEKMSEQLKEMRQNHNEQLSRLQLQLNLIKQDKKELHQELDNAHGQLIVYEKQRSKQKMAIVSEVRTQLQAKVSFIHDDVQKYKLETKKVRQEMKKLQKEHQVEIQARQQLYLKERHKLTQQIMKLNQQLSQLQERLKKANSIIAQEKLVLSQTNFKNQHFQLQYFQTKRLNQLYQHQIQTLNEEIKNLQLKNEKITKYLHQFDDKNSHIIAEMQAQIQSLMKQNDHYRQCVQQQKQRIKNLQEKNDKMSQQLRRKTLSTMNPSSFMQQLEKKQGLTTSENVKTFPYSEDTFFMMENPKTNQPQQKIFSQPIKNQKQILNLYDTPPSRDRVTFVPGLRQIPRQVLYTKQHQSQLILKPQNNYTLTGNKIYQNPESEIKSNRKVSLPLQKQKVEYYRI